MLNKIIDWSKYIGVVFLSAFILFEVNKIDSFIGGFLGLVGAVFIALYSKEIVNEDKNFVKILEIIGMSYLSHAAYEFLKLEKIEDNRFVFVSLVLSIYSFIYYKKILNSKFTKTILLLSLVSLTSFLLEAYMSFNILKFIVFAFSLFMIFIVHLSELKIEDFKGRSLEYLLKFSKGFIVNDRFKRIVLFLSFFSLFVFRTFESFTGSILYNAIIFSYLGFFIFLNNRRLMILISFWIATVSFIFEVFQKINISPTSLFFLIGSSFILLSVILKEFSQNIKDFNLSNHIPKFLLKFTVKK